MTVGTGLSKQHTVIKLGDKGLHKSIKLIVGIQFHHTATLCSVSWTTVFKHIGTEQQHFINIKLLVLFSYFLTHKVTCDFVRQVL